MTDPKLTADAIESGLAQHSGSETRYRHALTGLLYTPGVQDLAERCGAYWFLDKIATCQRLPKLRREPFQVWKLTVADQTAVISVTDGNDRKLRTERITYTDFPLAWAIVWVADRVILLPSEY